MEARCNEAEAVWDISPELMVQGSGRYEVCIITSVFTRQENSAEASSFLSSHSSTIVLVSQLVMQACTARKLAGSSYTAQFDLV
jgi:hypothetical protein